MPGEQANERGLADSIGTNYDQYRPVVPSGNTEIVEDGLTTVTKGHTVDFQPITHSPGCQGGATAQHCVRAVADKN